MCVCIMVLVRMFVCHILHKRMGVAKLLRKNGSKTPIQNRTFTDEWCTSPDFLHLDRNNYFQGEVF